LIVQGEGVRLYLFILISFTVEGEGAEFNSCMLWLRAFFKNVTGETTDAEESKEV
jgi:hypothetical protein